jgi:hypothetical protein
MKFFVKKGADLWQKKKKAAKEVANQSNLKARVKPRTGTNPNQEPIASSKNPELV